MKKILIIEDDKIVMASAKDLLEAEGYDVSTAENGRRGVLMAREVVPDLIICDVMMPEVDGHSVLTTLRELPDTSAIPFIFLTAKADKSDIRQGMKLGADDYLTKPYTRMDLLDAISSRLAKQTALTQRFTSQIQQVEAKLNYALHYDSVTGLPNRLLFREQFIKAIPQPTPPDWMVAVIYLGLDRFAQINDSLGPDYANLLLRGVTARLKECLGESASISRLHSGEFAIVLSGPRSTLLLPQICQAILEKIGTPYPLDQLEVYTSASLGISCYPENGLELESMLKNARTSMLHTKKQGGNAFQLYNVEMNTRSLDQLKLETSLRHALERNELEIYFQPQVDIRKGQVVGAEALLRWKHPEQGFISPMVFIPIAEETGLIHAIGDWVLKTACLKVKSWQDAGYPPLRLAVNISSRQIYQPNFTAKVAQIVKDTGLAPQNLELELTESTLIHEVDSASSILGKLKSLGIQIAIDDFGTGFSSLSYLKQFPFDTLKVDRYFVQNIGQDSENSAITLATIQMAHSLNLKVIAEGVETERELDFLSQHGCDEIQGYFYSRPLAQDSFEKLLASKKSLQDVIQANKLA
ncbi:MAG: response regulator [Chloroflexi bacterium]|nr:response regulator [Chloroflexota bacterium]